MFVSIDLQHMSYRATSYVTLYATSKNKALTGYGNTCGPSWSAAISIVIITVLSCNTSLTQIASLASITSQPIFTAACMGFWLSANTTYQ
jgi:hypothetical protein